MAAAAAVAAGIVAGFGLSMATGRILANEVFGLSPYSPRILVTGGALLMLSALMAGWHPARRAASTDPMESLRAD